ncbi:hypothetical protein ACLOJK_008821 [Asimina triloba]
MPRKWTAAAQNLVELKMQRWPLSVDLIEAMDNKFVCLTPGECDRNLHGQEQHWHENCRPILLRKQTHMEMVKAARLTSLTHVANPHLFLPFSVAWLNLLNHNSFHSSNQFHLIMPKEERERKDYFKMAKLQAAPVLALSLLCLFSLLGFASCHDPLFVEGIVYCDTCRAGFETRLSEPLEGAKVKLECRSLVNNEITITKEALSNSSGLYHIPVETDHEEDLCEVIAVESPREDCNKCNPGRDRARILLTRNVGIVSNVRHANPLGYMKNDIIEGCTQVLKEMGFGK